MRAGQRYVWPVAIAALALVFTAIRHLPTVRAAARQNTSGLQIQLAAQNAVPRTLEDTTQQAIVRDYGLAWKAMEHSLAQNNDNDLEANFAGTALNNIKARLDSQSKNGITIRMVDHGHKLEAVFYSPEGSAMQLHDVAQLELRTYANGSLVDTRNVTAHYVVLMTTAQDRWKVRLLQQTQ